MARISGISKNLEAFLDMIAVSEGTAGRGDDGYNILVGGSTFHDYRKHPGLLVNLGHGLKSTAAGRYQFLKRTAREYMIRLNLRDFSPVSQDRMAIEVLRDKRAINLIEIGQIDEAIKRVGKVWASFPHNSYGQRQHTTKRLLAVYQSARNQLA